MISISAVAHFVSSLLSQSECSVSLQLCHRRGAFIPRRVCLILSLQDHEGAATYSTSVDNRYAPTSTRNRQCRTSTPRIIFPPKLHESTYCWRQSMRTYEYSHRSCRTSTLRISFPPRLRRCGNPVLWIIDTHLRVLAPLFSLLYKHSPLRNEDGKRTSSFG